MPPTQSIGERIKTLRVEEGITLAELGGRVDLSVSYLSQIERDRTTPSISTLTSIAKALNVGLRYFFEIDAEAAHIVRRGEAQEPARPDIPIRRQSLTPEAGNSNFEVHRVTLQPNTTSEELVQRPGEEFVLVLAGEMTITVGEEQIMLAVGDSIHYDALQPHCWENKGNEPSVVIWSRAISRTERKL